jgi:hypothetical protein
VTLIDCKKDSCLQESLWVQHGASYLQSWLLQRWRLGRLWFKIRPGKTLARPHLNKKASMVACICHSSYVRSIGRKDPDPSWLGCVCGNMRSYLKNN